MKGLRLFVFIVAIGFGVVSQNIVTSAQTGVTVSGTTEDPSGAVIPGEKLLLVNKVSRETRRTVSDDSGNFRFSDVAPGEYSLEGQAEGFANAEMKLTVGSKPLIIAVRMEIRISEDVIVNAKELQPELAENNADAVEINANLMRGLPLRNDNLLSVLNNFLSPAAMGFKGPSIVVDGIDDSTLDIPASALRRIVINKNPYSAEYRRPGVARIEVTTKQGSRKVYDGSVALFLRDSKLNARNAFALEKTPSDLQLFEGHFSGPLPFFKSERISAKKNRRKFVPSASFFLSGNRMNNDDTAVVNALTPSGTLNENVPTLKTSTNLLGRFDFVPTRLTKWNFRYSFHDQPEYNVGVGGLHLAEQGVIVRDREHKFQLQESTAFSNSFLNTFRFVFARESQKEGIRATLPEIKVKGAFTGGPAQTAKLEEETSLQFQDIASYSHGQQTIRFGGAFLPRSIKIMDASNFGGKFTFSSLDNFSAQAPTLFEIVRGDPEVSYSHPEGYVFVQDEIRPRQDLSLMLGLRYEWQAKLEDHNNFAPRVAVAFAPGDKKTVFRAGSGIFYDRLPTAAVARSRLFDGQRLQDFIIDDPSFPIPFFGNERPTKPSVWRIASDLSAPYLIQSGVGVERRLGLDKQLTVEYLNIRGLHLLRARNINAPVGLDGVLPDPDFVLINQVESSASLHSNALVVALQGGLFENFKGIIQYTLSGIKNDTSGTFSLPANNYDLRPEWGRADLDRQHRLNVAGTLSMPLDTKLGTIFAFTSESPYEITTGDDDNSDRVVNDRPRGVFRNAGHGPNFAQWDVRLTKFFEVPTPFTKDLTPGDKFRNLELTIDVFNLLNRNNLFDVVGETASPLFGKATTSLQARTFQLSFKYSF